MSSSSADPELSAAEHGAMRELRSLLCGAGYSQLYHHAAGGVLFAAERGRAFGAVRRLPSSERAVLELLALGEEVPAGEASAQLRRAVGALRGAGLVRDGGDRVATTGWVVVPTLRGYLITGTPPHYATGEPVGARAYIGNDSLLLAAALPDARGTRVLDLGAGCGVQGLLAARGAAEAVLTDVDAFACKVSLLNTALNETPHPVRVLAGDLYEPVQGERFDLITMLPPYVPTVDGSATSGVAAGGPDGLGLIRRLVREAPAHLAPGGELVALCQLLCSDEGPLLAAEIGALCPSLDVRLSVTDWHPLQPYALDLARRLSRHAAPADMSTLLARYLRSLRSLGVTGACTAHLRLRRGDGAGSVRVIGQAPAVRARSVPAPLPGLSLTGDVHAATATSTDGTQSFLSGPTAALLAAVDGRRTIADIALAAWGTPEGAHPDDLCDQAIERFLELERAELVILDAND